MKIGILGGSFNPPHKMHLEIGINLINKHYVDKVTNFGVAKLLPDHFLINSWHHQAVKVVPEGFEVLFKNDETIEAMEHKTLPIVAVQWHPERFYTAESKVIFDYFFDLIK